MPSIVTTSEDLILGLIIGFSIGLTGIGGGVLILPSLTLLLGIPPTVAVGTANLYAVLSKTLGTYHHWKQRTISFTSTAHLLAGAIPVNIVVAVLVTRYAQSIQANQAAMDAFESALHRFIAVVVVGSALLILWGVVRNSTSEAREPRRRRWLPLRNQTHRKVAAILFGAIVGGLVASTSIGGGVLVVPFLLIVLGLTPVETVGSSIMLAVVLTFFSSIVYAVSGQLDFVTAIVMAAGSLISVPLGASVGKKLPGRVLECLVGGLVLFAGGLMLLGGGE